MARKKRSKNASQKQRSGTKRKPKAKRQRSLEKASLTEIEARQYFNDAAGDEEEEWSDIDYFDESEIDTFVGVSEDVYEDKKGRQSIGRAIGRIYKTHSKFDSQTGLLYNKESDKKRKTESVTLHSVFVSDEGKFLLRPHEFKSDEKRTPEQWNRWLGRHYGKILRDDIIPNMDSRTDGQQWRLYRIVGVTQNVLSRPAHTTKRKKRNKAKR